MQNYSDLVEHLREQHLSEVLDTDICRPSQRTSRFKLVILLWIVIGGIAGLASALFGHAYHALP